MNDVRCMQAEDDYIPMQVIPALDIQLSLIGNKHTAYPSIYLPSYQRKRLFLNAELALHRRE